MIRDWPLLYEARRFDILSPYTPKVRFQIRQSLGLQVALKIS